MPLIEDFDIAVEMAGKILLKRGRISLSEIRHVPFVESELEAVAVAQNLIHKYDVEVVEDKWNGEITIHLYNLAAKLKQAKERRRRSLLRHRPREITRAGGDGRAPAPPQAPTPP